MVDQWIHRQSGHKIVTVSTRRACSASFSFEEILSLLMNVWLRNSKVLPAESGLVGREFRMRDDLLYETRKLKGEVVPCLLSA